MRSFWIVWNTLVSLRYTGEKFTSGLILKQQDRLVSVGSMKRESSNKHNICSDKGCQAVPNEPYSGTVVCKTLLVLPMCTYFGNLTKLGKTLSIMILNFDFGKILSQYALSQIRFEYQGAPAAIPNSCFNLFDCKSTSEQD